MDLIFLMIPKKDDREIQYYRCSKCGRRFSSRALEFHAKNTHNIVEFETSMGELEVVTDGPDS